MKAELPWPKWEKDYLGTLSPVRRSERLLLRESARSAGLSVADTRDTSRHIIASVRRTRRRRLGSDGVPPSPSTPSSSASTPAARSSSPSETHTHTGVSRTRQGRRRTSRDSTAQSPRMIFDIPSSSGADSPTLASASSLVRLREQPPPPSTKETPSLPSSVSPLSSESEVGPAKPRHPRQLWHSSLQTIYLPFRQMMPDMLQLFQQKRLTPDQLKKQLTHHCPWLQPRPQESNQSPSGWVETDFGPVHMKFASERPGEPGFRRLLWFLPASYQLQERMSRPLTPQVERRRALFPSTQYLLPFEPEKHPEPPPSQN